MRIFPLFILTLLAGTTLNAQFYPPVPLTNDVRTNYSLDAGYGDIDADGHVDIVDFAYNKLWVIYTEPDGSFSEESYNSGLEEIDFVETRVLDFDGDGDMDVATGTGWLENQNGDFQGEHFFTTNHCRSQFTVFQDLNADGFPDVFLPTNQNGPFQYKAIVILNDGTGEFLHENVIIVEDYNLNNSVFDDFDNDGDLDLFTSDGTDNYVYLNDGSGHFNDGNITIPGNSWVYFVKDLNGDGYADLFSPQGYEFVFRFNDQSGGYLSEYVIEQTDYIGWWYYLFTDFTADFDDDGDIDILYRTTSNDVYFIENLGNEEFQNNGIISYCNSLYDRGALIIQDMNEDGTLDLVRPMQNMYVEIQKGDVQMLAWTIYSAGVNRNNAELTAFDFDQDGDEDIMSSVMDGIGVYENLGNNQNSAIQFLGSYHANKILGIDDYNNDGMDDIVSYIHDNQFVYVTVNYGASNGTYEDTQYPIDEEMSFKYPYLADIDLDGKKDLVLVSYTLPVTVTWYSFSETEYSGPFTLGSWSNSGSTTQSWSGKAFVEGDYNGDGFMDFSVAAQNEVRLLLGDGAGNYSIVDPLPSNTLMIHHLDGSAADFNQDGIDDIAYITSNSNNGNLAMGILTYNGTGYVNHTVTTENTPSQNFYHDFLHADFDQDGDEDLIYNAVESVRILLNNGDASFSDAYSTTFGYSEIAIRSIELVHLNNDFLPDLVIGIGDANSTIDQIFYKAVNALDSPYQVRCHVFYDANGNGIQDSGEDGINERQIAFSSPHGYHYTHANGMFTLYCEPGTIEASINQNTLIWNASTPWSQTVVVDSSNPVADVYFGMEPIGSQPILESTITVVSGPCDAMVAHVLTITNTGNTIASGYLDYQVDSLYTFLEANMAPEILGVQNPILRWYFNDLYYGESFTIELTLNAPDYTHIGEMMHSELSANITDVNDIVIFSGNDTYDELVTCAFDPNALEELQGQTDAGYVRAGDDLEFEIQFQNLGNAPATHVRIEDQLSAQLDWTSLQPIAVSHPYEIMIDETGYLTFTFQNIQLPDATSDELNSHGFARFRIRTLTSLPAWDVIENTASIYFDFNPPVHTNTTINTIYDCADLFQGSLSSDTLCLGEDITGSNGAVWIDELSWSYAGEEIALENLQFEPDQSGDLQMNASNGLCQAEMIWAIIVNQPISNFTQDLNMLTSAPAITYQWMLDGEPIAGAAEQHYPITTSGNYSVLITDENGCMALSEEMEVIYTGVDGENEINFQLSPNPVSTHMTIRTGSEHYTSLAILDMQGRVVMNLAMANATTKTFDVNALPNGTYVLQSPDHSVCKSFQIFR